MITETVLDLPFTALLTGGYVKSGRDFSIRFLGKSWNHYAMCRAGLQKVSLDCLANLLVRLDELRERELAARVYASICNEVLKEKTNDQ